MPDPRLTPAVQDGFPGQRMVVLPRPTLTRAMGKPLLADLLPTDIGYFPEASGHEVHRRVGVPQLILIYCVRGHGWARLGRREVPVSAGQVLLIPPGMPHAYGAAQTRPWTIYWLHLTGTKVSALHRMLTAETPIIHLGENAEAASLLSETCDILQRSYADDSLICASLTVGRLFARLIQARKDEPTSDTHDRIAQTLEFMRRRLAHRISVNELARMANLSQSHFAGEFKRRTGFAVLDYFVRLRMQRAAQLLDTTPTPVKTIAAQVGYDDPLYFSRQFRKVHGSSPSEYRSVRKG